MLNRVKKQFLLPPEVDARLEHFLTAVRTEGGMPRASRSDIVNALIWHSDEDGDELGVLIRNCYREVEQSEPAEAPVAGPGPRPFVPHTSS